MSEKFPPLIADRMCGKLAKYLRIMGFEVCYPPAMTDINLIGMAIRKSAVLLTRDRWIEEKMRDSSRADQVILLKSDDVYQQVCHVLDRLGIAGPPFVDNARCIYCGGELLELNAWEAKNLVPPYVFRTQIEIFHCPICNLQFWKGTQWQSFEGRLVNFSKTYSEGKKISENS